MGQVLEKRAAKQMLKAQLEAQKAEQLLKQLGMFVTAKDVGGIVVQFRKHLFGSGLHVFLD